MASNSRLVNLRIGKRTYPVRTALGAPEIQRVESLLDAFACNGGDVSTQEENLVLLALKLAYALEEARHGLEKLAGFEGES
jgi:hypothetical protein